MQRTVRFWVGFLLVLGLMVAGCRSTSDWNPFVDLSSYEVIVIEDFEDRGTGVGSELADQVASELLRLGDYREVLREPTGDNSIVVEGDVQRYVEGNVPARIKYGSAVGQSSMKVEVRISVEPSQQFVGSFTITESTLMTGPDARRTGREDIDWIQREVARQIAERLANQK
ncbi:DUF4410 domain-containing protein [Pelagicoccus sp. SDUM812003]|uniref:DUF4410 domain-containing protein n=1 Tax=Pelagicoccus sp. SDUM812003 TaxID=3041267 RepID=UPI00280D3882|nr:DUF4410 domain-containing protein [Pelagicoccus sp. SDUM812003]MDQ8204890.1 DUF4410 domain-containing protein [Pelagicoccus sp. SDUM812003]